MIKVICPQDGVTILGEVGNEEQAATLLAHTSCNVCGWSPVREPTALEALELKAPDYIRFGSDLYTSIKQKVWAVNVLAKSQGSGLTPQQMVSLLQNSDTLEKSLKTGSLDMAQIVIAQLVQALPQYKDIGDWAVIQLKSFLGE